MARRIVFTESGFWKYFWAHLVMSMTESCRWVMQCRLRPWRPWASNKVLSALFLKHIDFSSFSFSFEDVMHCKLWDLQSLCHLTLRNIVFKVFHNLFTHFFRLESLCPSLLLRDSVMSPGLAIIPLTTRGHHLPSSWTQLPQLHTPVTYYTLSCCPLSQTLYFPLSHHSAWLIICCSCCYSGDTCTVLPFYVSHSLTRFVFLPCFFY